MKPVWPLLLLVPGITVSGCAADSAPSAGQQCTPRTCVPHLTRLAEISDSLVPGAFRTDTRRLISRDGSGRFVALGSTEILVFDSSGALITTVGRPGEGPGEFRLPASPLIGPGDSIHVYDYAARRMTVFAPDLTAARQFQAPGRPELVLEDGSYLLATQIRTSDRVGFPLHRLSPGGQLLNSFGTDTPQYRPDLPLLTSRVVAPAGQSQVWAAAPGRYILERWAPGTGTRTARLIPRSEWFEGAVRVPSDGRVRPPSIVSGLWEDPEGRLWVVTQTADENWKPDPSRSGEYELDPAVVNSVFDWMIEVIDPESGDVLASRRFPERLTMNPENGLVASLDTVGISATRFDVWEPELQLRRNE